MKNPHNLLLLGLGLGLGACSIWVLFELWPVVVMAGAGYIVLKSLEGKSSTWQEYDTCAGYQKK